MSEKRKLKPEHRKLWRRVYLDEFEGHGATPEEAEAMADKVVASWDARGAFDDYTDTQSSPPMEPTKPFAVRFPHECVLTLHKLGDDIIGKHVAMGGCADREAVELRALTPYGDALLRVALPHDIKKFVAAIRLLHNASPIS